MTNYYLVTHKSKYIAIIWPEHTLERITTSVYLKYTYFTFYVCIS